MSICSAVLIQYQRVTDGRTVVTFPEKLLKTIATRCAIFSLKFTKNHLAALGSAQTRWGAWALPQAHSRNMGPTRLLLREGEGKEGKGGERIEEGSEKGGMEWEGRRRERKGGERKGGERKGGRGEEGREGTGRERTRTRTPLTHVWLRGCFPHRRCLPVVQQVLSHLAWRVVSHVDVLRHRISRIHRIFCHRWKSAEKIRPP